LQNKIRVRAVSEVFISLGEFTDAGIIAFFEFHIQYYLEVQVRGPVTVFGRGTEMGDLLANGDILAGRNMLNIRQAEVAI
jgi:hypothetical protein